MSKSLYDASYRYAEDALRLDARIGKEVSQVFAEYMQLGYSPREIGTVLHAAIHEAELEQVLTFKGIQHE